MLEWQLNIIIYYEELNRMGYQLTSEGFDSAIKALSAQYRIWAPVNKKGAGRHEATDVVIYDEVHSGSEIEFNKKSDYAFKEAILPSTTENVNSLILHSLAARNLLKTAFV